jgi:glycosyltransferase involved in cell wall biosynthesis/GT2 family glycosyltransferase
MSAITQAQAISTGNRLSMLVVTPKGVIGGAEAWLLAVLDNMRSVDVTVVVLQGGPLVPALEALGLRVIVFDTGRNMSQMAGASRFLMDLARAEQPDVLFGNSIKSALSLILPAKVLGIPLGWIRHDDSFHANLGHVAMQSADLSVIVAPRKPWDRRYETVYLMPPVLHEPHPREESTRILRERGVPDDGLLRIGIFARLAPYKGIDTMLEALSRPGAENWRLIVAGIEDPGAPGEGERLEKLAAELGVSGRVSWLGQVPQAGRLASGMDVMGIPTRVGGPGFPPGEGFGTIVAEAFAAGTPVICDPRTVSGVTTPGYMGGVVEIDANDVDTLVAGLVRLSDPQVRAELGAAAQVIGDSHPRPPQTAADLTERLSQLCSRPGITLTEGPAMSVVSTVRNEAEGIEAWLQRILGQLSADDEIVIVDGGSTDGTLDRLRVIESQEGRLRVVEAAGAGISEGRNIGIEAARHDWIACTDAGCDPDEGWLDAFRRAAAVPETDLVTGVYRAGSVEGKAWEQALAAVAYPVPDELRRTTPLVRGYTKVFGRAYDATLPTGRSVAFTKDAWRAAGGFPEDLATAEDVLFGKRAVAAGAQAVLSRDAAVTWYQRPTLRGNLRMFRGYGRGDGQSGDRQLIARDLARAGAYTGAPVLWLTAPRTRPVLAAAAALYLSVPVRRTLRGEKPVATTALVPAMAAARDVAKAVGAVEGIASRRRAKG